MRLNKNTGDILYSQTHLPKPLFLEEYNALSKVYRLSNNHYILCTPHDYNTQNYTVGHPFYSIIEFDADLKVTRSFTILYTLNRLLFKGPPNFDITVDSDGNIVLCLENNMTGDYEGYIGKLDRNAEIVLQKKIKIKTSLNNSFDWRQLLFQNYDGSTLLLPKYHNSSTSFGIDMYKINIDHPLNNSNCILQQDSAFINLQESEVASSNIRLYKTDATISRDQSVILLSENVPFAQEEFCEKINKCDSIKLSGKNSFCISNTVAFQVHKSQPCLRQIDWNVDTIPATIVSNSGSNIVLKFLKPWSGYLKAKINGCGLVDSIYIRAYQQSQSMNLGPDRSLCSGNNIKLSAGANFRSYRWQDGSMDSVYSVTKPGTYYVFAEDFCNNKFTDTIYVYSESNPLLERRDTAVCKFQKLELIALPGFLNYQWASNYYITESTQKSITVFPENNGTYFVVAEKYKGCFVQDKISVRVKDCSHTINMPTAFSPNHGGKNDFFKPIIYGTLEVFEFVVYDRWGQEVFKAKNQYDAWDGKQNGKVMAAIYLFGFADIKF